MQHVIAVGDSGVPSVVRGEIRLYDLDVGGGRAAARGDHRADAVGAAVGAHGGAHLVAVVEEAQDAVRGEEATAARHEHSEVRHDRFLLSLVPVSDGRPLIPSASSPKRLRLDARRRSLRTTRTQRAFDASAA